MWPWDFALAGAARVVNAGNLGGTQRAIEHFDFINVSGEIWERVLQRLTSSSADGKFYAIVVDVACCGQKADQRSVRIDLHGCAVVSECNVRPLILRRGK